MAKPKSLLIGDACMLSRSVSRSRKKECSEAITGFVGIVTTLGGLVLLAVLLTTISDYFAKQVEEKASRAVSGHAGK